MIREQTDAMKRHAIILSATLFTLLMVSFTSENENGNGNSLTSNVYFPVSDTIISNQVVRVSPFDLPIIPPSSGVQFFKDGIVFLSSSRMKGKMLSDHLSFGTLATHFAVLKDSVLGSPQVFSQNEYPSFTFPSDGITFSGDYKTMYFANYSESDGFEKIYHAEVSEREPEDWLVDLKPLSFCTDNSIYTHPSISTDGKLLVFASNRSGSYGGMDLWVTLEKDGKWSEPENLGNAVNSSFNELYPYLDSNNNLYFSSDNTQGYGGYDIYVCKFKSNTWEKPINLSTPVNTMFDDVAFKVDMKDCKSGFYTVKQKSGSTPTQLFRISLNDKNQADVLTLSQYFTRPDNSQMVILALEPAVQATDNQTRTATKPAGEGDKVVYRVQFLTSFNPQTRTQITVEGKGYNVFEYLYSGAYRLCIGEFTGYDQAVELQSLLIKNDYPNVSVVVFVNDVLSLDPELLKVKPQTDATKAAGVAVAGTKTVPAEVKTPDTEVKKTEPAKAVIPVAVVKDTTVTKPATSNVVYRVQLLSAVKSKASYEIVLNNKPYKTFEYVYSGSYRTCIGEFSTLAPAKELQGIARKGGYPEAFVVAFKDNVRSTDPALFK